MAHNKQNYNLFASGLAIGGIHEKGENWGYEKVRNNREKWPSIQQATWLECFQPSSITWKVAAELGEETDKKYWQLISPYGINKEDAEGAFKAFMWHGRSLTALHLAQRGVSQGSIPPPLLLADALKAALTGSIDFRNKERLHPEELIEIINFIADSGEVDSHIIEKLEFALMPLHELDRSKSKVLDQKLASSPEFFGEILKMGISATCTGLQPVKGK